MNMRITFPPRTARPASAGPASSARRWLAGLLASLAAFGANADNNLTPEQAAVIERHADYWTTLKTEQAFREALAQRDLQWLQNSAEEFKRDDLPVLQQAEFLRDANFAFAMGACHEASVALRMGILAVATKGLPKRLPVPADHVVPLQIREQFVDHMRRCEMIKRHTRTERKIGAGLGW